MASGTSERGQPIYGINVTPLVDVVLVLLIAVMVTASYAVSEALPMDLPEASTGKSESSPMTISIQEDGALFFDQARVSKQRLGELVSRAKGEGIEHALIAAAAKTEHRRVVGVIDLLRTRGITHFAINVSPSDLTSAP